QRMGLADCGAADTEMGLLELLLVVEHAGILGRWTGPLVTPVALYPPEQPRAVLDQPVVIARPGPRDKHPAGAVALRHEGGQQFAVDTVDGRFRAEDRQGERMPLP